MKSQIDVIVDACKIYRRGEFCAFVNPFVTLSIDESEAVQTKPRKNEFKPSFGDSFTFTNITSASTIDVRVLSQQQPSPSSSAAAPLVVGYCAVALSRIPRSGERTQWYLLATEEPPVSEDPNTSSSSGIVAGNDSPTRSDDSPARRRETGGGNNTSSRVTVAGYVKLTLRSSSALLASGHMERLNLDAETAFTHRLERFFLHYDRQHLGLLNVVIGDAVDSSEVASSARGGGGSGVAPHSRTASNTTDDGDRTTFDEIMAHLVATYGPEPVVKRVTVTIAGGSDFIKPLGQAAIAPFIVLVSDSEQIETQPALGETDPTFSTEGTFTLVDADTTTLQVLVVNNSRFRESAVIGQSPLSLVCLLPRERNFRTVPVTITSFDANDEGGPVTEVSGRVHLCLTPKDFGTADATDSKVCDDMYARLERLFARYDPTRLPSIDSLVRRHTKDMDGLMARLVGVYGKEPGSAVLHVLVREIRWLGATPGQKLATRVVAKVSMGDAELVTRPVHYTSFVVSQCEEDDALLLDVSRETDVLSIEIVDAETHASFGRVDLTVVGIQRAAWYTRTLTLVANAGKEYAKCAGQIVLQLLSSDLGKATPVNDTLEAIQTHRLRTFCATYLREKLHRVDIAVATTQDMELFMRDLVRDLGPEPPSLRLTIRVLAAKDLPNRMGGIHPMVAVWCGNQLHTTAVVRSTNPLFGDVFIFDLDGSSPDAAEVVFAVVDTADGDSAHATVLAEASIHTKDLPMDVDETHWMELKGRVASGMVGAQFFLTRVQRPSAERLPVVADARRAASPPSSTGGEGGVSPRGTAALPPQPAAAAGAASRRPAARGPRSPTKGAITPRGVSASGTTTPRRRVAEGDPQQPPSGSKSGGTKPLDVSAIASSASTPAHQQQQQVQTGNVTPSLTRMRQDFATPNTATASQRSAGRTPTSARRVVPALFGTSPSSAQRPSLTQAALLGSPPLASSPALLLDVKIYSCENLQMPTHAGQPVPPATMQPFVTVATELSKFRTDDAPVATYEPEYNQTFKLRLRDLFTDAVKVTVQTTQKDESKKVAIVGKAILSARGLRKGVERVLWVDLVHNAGRPQAYVRGRVKVGLTAPADFLPLEVLAEVDQAMLRVQARQVLLARAPHDLHKLEYFLGEFCGKPDRLLPKLHELCSSDAGAPTSLPPLQSLVDPPATAASPSTSAGRHVDPNRSSSSSSNNGNIRNGTEAPAAGAPLPPSEFHTVKVCVVSAQLLWTLQAQPETAYVRLKSALEKFTTKKKPGGRKFITYDELFSCQVDATTSTFEVKFVGQDGSGKDALVGIAVVSTDGLVRGVSRDKTVSLVSGAGTKAAKVIGTLALSLETLHTTNPSSAATTPAAAEMASLPSQREACDRCRRRVQRTLEHLQPQELHRLDVWTRGIAAGPAATAAERMDALVASVAQRFGGSPAAEPRAFALDIAVGSVQQLPRTDSTPGGCTPYVILSVGNHQRTTRTIKSTTGAAAFGEQCVLDVQRPDEAVLVVRVMDVGASCDTESGRVVVPLSHLALGVPRTTSHALAFEAMLGRATLRGSVKLHLTAKDFGGSVAMVALQHRSDVVAAVEDALARRRPDLLHTAEVIAAQQGGYTLASALAYIDALPSIEAIRESSRTQSASPRGGGSGQLLSGGGSSGGLSQSHVGVVGFKRFFNAPCGKVATPSACVVKVYVSGASMGKTKPLKLPQGGLDSVFAPEDSKVPTPILKRSDVLTFKIVVPKVLLGSTTLALVDMNVNRLPSGGDTRWLPFFDEASGTRLGLLGVHVHLDPTSDAYHPQSPARDDTTATNISGSNTSRQAHDLLAGGSGGGGHASVVEREPSSTVQRVMEDVACLLRKHKPSLLRNLSVHVEQRPLELAHSQLRQAFAPTAIASIDVFFHSVQFLGHPLALTKDVRLRVSSNTDRAVSPPFHAAGGQSLVKLTECSARLDVLRIDDLSPLVFELVLDGIVIVAAAKFPLRALLTPALFPLEDIVTLPLITVERQSGGGGSTSPSSPHRAFVQAELRFSLRLPLFEAVPSSMGYPDRCTALLDRPFVMHYFHAIGLSLSLHEPDALFDFAVRFFDVDVAKSPWVEVLPARMAKLVQAYGPTFPPTSASTRDGSGSPRVSDATRKAIFEQFSHASRPSTPGSSKSSRATRR